MLNPKQHIPMKYILFLFLLIPIWTQAQNNDSSSLKTSYKIYDVALQKEVTLSDMALSLAAADVIFFGEEHLDSIAHLLQLELFKSLHQVQQKPLSLSMEMFQTDVQLVLDEYLQGLIRENNMLNDSRPWNNYADYRPLVEYAREQGLKVLAANAPSRYTNRVTRHGLASLIELSTEAKQLIAPLPIDTLRGRYYEKFAALLGGHEGMGNMKIYQSQNVWDATMAWQIAQLQRQQPLGLILHINGKFHSDERLGTYAHLQQYNSSLQLKNISCISISDIDQPQWAEKEYLADFIIVTQAE